MSHDNSEKFSFRYLRADAALVEAILSHEPGAAVHVRGEKTTVVIRLREGGDYTWIREVNERFKLAPDRFGVWVSLVTEWDSEIVGLPPYAVDLVRLVGGRVEFSVTFIADDPGAGSES